MEILEEENRVIRSISIIIPVYNEVECVEGTYYSIKKILDAEEYKYEIIIVNDGSQDGTEKVLDRLANGDQKLSIIHFALNYGQTAAMMAGIDHARGDVIITIDADGQNDPGDIPRLLEKIDEGYDVVSGWRIHRQDRLLSRKIPSKIANWLISKVSGVKLNDYGCSLKAYRASVIKNVKLYGEMHRFIPIYARWYGARVIEIPVNHRARTSGISKYGINRTAKVILDLLVVKFLQSYMTKPIYVMGGFGLFCMALGGGSFLYASYLKFFKHISFIQTPLLLAMTLFILLGITSILLGITCEIVVRTYFESQSKRPYHIRNINNTSQHGTSNLSNRASSRS
jgi:glycosyltransferase involved in cell wall biosynthesis